MLIYNFFTSIVPFLQLITNVTVVDERYKMLLLIALGIGVLLWLALFVLQGVGVYVMAKKRNVGKSWLAFVPFAQTFYMGKLAGECSFFGQKMKRAGLYAMLSQILAVIVCISVIAAEAYLYFKCGLPRVEIREYYGIQLEEIVWDVVGFDNAVWAYYDVVSPFLLFIFPLVAHVFLLVLHIGLFKKYAPSNYMLFAILSLLITPASYIIVFVLRNRKAVDYASYIRAKQEEFMRRQQQYYNQYGNPYNPYGNPYNRPPYQGGYNPYGNSYGQPDPQARQNRQNQEKPADEPFAEFASNKNTGNTNTENGNNGESSGKDSDDFFN